MKRKHITVITTGGTIAMREDAKTGGLVPAVSGADLLEAIPAIASVADVDVVEFSNIPSGWMTVECMAKLARLIDELAEKRNTQGFVVTHGTDTLEETAYFLETTLRTHCPVCVTGAMRGAGEAGYDGGVNILDAIRVATDDCSKEMGVTVCLNRKIYAARGVTKMHTTDVDTFRDLNCGPLGMVYGDKVMYERKPMKYQKVKVVYPETEVWILSVWSGMSEKSIEVAGNGAKGVIINGLGCGNVPPFCKKGIEDLCRIGIPVVLATSVPAGRVQEEYGYDGSARSMRKAGIILAGDLTAKKARILLSLLLGQTNDLEEIRSYFEK